MSSEQRSAELPQQAAAAPTPDRRASRAYRRFSLLLLGTIAVIAALLALLNLTQGPRLADVQVNPVSVTTLADQSVTLLSNQPLAAVTAQQVTVTPAVPFRVEAATDRVVVRFDAPLAYATEYTVQAEVLGAHTGAASVLKGTFVTQDPMVTVLVRDDAGQDSIERQRLMSGEDRGTVFAAQHIEAYAALGDDLLVVERGADERPVVGMVSRDDGAITPFVSGTFDSITQLRVEPATRMAGYVLAGTGGLGQHFRGTLLLQDLRFGAGPPIEVLGSDLRPLEVASWAFAADGTSIVAMDYAGDWYRFVPLQGDVAAKPLAEPPPEASTGEVQLGDVRISRVTADGTPAQLWQPGARLTISDAANAAASAGSDRVLFAPAAESSRIGRVCPSPNAELVAVEVVSAEGVADGYVSEPGFTRTTTSFVRLADGAVVTQLPGMLPSWCQ